jgi:hypothetical protein
VVSGCLFLLAIALWPDVLGRMVTLDWHIGDLRPALRLLSIASGGCAAAAVLESRRVAAIARAVCPSYRHLWFGVLTLSLTTVACAGLGEFALAMFDLPFRQNWVPSENAVATFDPELGWSYIANHAGVQRFGSDSRPVDMIFDEFGARVARAGDRHDRRRPSLLLVGCSFTMGHGLTHEESIAGQLERLPGFPLQVVNLAVQGYGTDQALLQLRRYMDHFNTRVVVYGFLCDHVRRNANRDRRLLYPGGRFLGTKPRFQLDKDGALVQTDWPERYGRRTGFRLVDLARVVLTAYGPRETLGVTRALVREMADQAAARGASFVVLNWNLGDRGNELCGPRPFDGLSIQVVRLADDAPEGWSEWTLPGDLHPDARSTKYAAEVLFNVIRTLE